MKKLLILGATGMLGSDLLRQFTGSPSWEVYAPTRAELDVCDFSALQAAFHTLRPAAVINAVAYTNVDGAETECEAAWALNAVLPEQLAALADATKARLIHFSTDQVFDGTKSSPWEEEDTPCPINYYGESKLEGEIRVRAFPDTLTLRVQWLYGRKKDRFTPLKDKDVFTPFSDQYGCPTWTEDISHTVATLLDREVTGLYHYAYDDYASWFEVFQFVCRELHFSTQLVPRRTAEVKLPARRPLFSALCNRKLAGVLCTSLGAWEQRLREFLSRQTRRNP